jgi:hypothetical protein
MSEAPRVQIKTSLGTFEVELYAKHAPKTCQNFQELSRRGYYNNTVVRCAAVSNSQSAVIGPDPLPSLCSCTGSYRTS